MLGQPLDTGKKRLPIIKIREARYRINVSHIGVLKYRNRGALAAIVRIIIIYCNNLNCRTTWF